MTPAQLDEARRWTALRGWRWLPGMLARYVSQSDGEVQHLRVYEATRYDDRDVADGIALANAFNAGSMPSVLGAPGGMFTFMAKAGAPKRLRGVRWPVFYDEDGFDCPALVDIGGTEAIPDTTDPATKGCLLALAREITGRPTLFAEPVVEIEGDGVAWHTCDLTPGEDAETLALLAACEDRAALEWARAARAARGGKA